jgi:hypothetical protein
LSRRGSPKKPIAEGADLIHAEIVRNLETADLVLCDISALNANVFFEFGIRTALDRPICLVRDEHTKLPFDVGGINCHQYASSLAAWELTQEIERLAGHVKVAARRADGHNALWRHFGLTQRGRDAIDATPDDATSAAIRVLAEEIQSLRTEIQAREPDALAIAPTRSQATAVIRSFAANNHVPVKSISFDDGLFTVAVGRRSEAFEDGLRRYLQKAGVNLRFVEQS